MLRSIFLLILAAFSLNATPIEFDDLQNDEVLTEHYINLIDVCRIAKLYRDHAVPNPIILNPDLMGAMLQMGSSASIRVDQCLNLAIQYFNSSIHPPSFENTVEGYMQSVNWVMEQFGSDLPFAWAHNLWAGS